MPKTLKSYWQKYDLLYKKCSKKDLFKRLKNECKKLGMPYQKKDPRGRKPKFSPITYTAYLCVQKIFRHRYREMELDATLYLPDKADHSTFHRNFEKIPEEYFEKLVEQLVNKKFIIWIADSTGMSSKIRVPRTREGIRKKELLVDKYHIIIGYDPPTSTVQILGVKATDNKISDSKGAITLLKGKKSNAYFLGDSAYNTYELHEMIQEVGLYPLMKPDNKGIKKTLSVKARQVKMFVKKIYKEIRGIVETVFGGATNAGLILSYAKKEHTRRLDTITLAIRHNLLSNIKTLIQSFMRQTRSARLCPKSCLILFDMLCSIALMYVCVLAVLMCFEFMLFPYFCFIAWYVLSMLLLLLYILLGNFFFSSFLLFPFLAFFLGGIMLVIFFSLQCWCIHSASYPLSISSVFGILAAFFSRYFTSLVSCASFALSLMLSILFFVVVNILSLYPCLVVLSSILLT